MKTLTNSKFSVKRLFISLTTVALVVVTGSVMAGTNLTIAQVATTITSNFEDLTKLMTAIAYVAGVAFAIASIMKFKQHKDNPTQIPIGTPIALLFVSAALLFLPTVLGVAGASIFGSSATMSTTTGEVPGQ